MLDDNCKDSSFSCIVSVAAAEAAVGLAIIIVIGPHRGTLNVQEKRGDSLQTR